MRQSVTDPVRTARTPAVVTGVRRVRRPDRTGRRGCVVRHVSRCPSRRRRGGIPRPWPAVGSAGQGRPVAERRAVCVAQLQAAPLRENPVGAELLPVWVAWNPMVVDPPGGIAAL
ncbi:hypothetical protein GCM10009661_14330 [Catellatospora chokoriensis]|uniref:Uncharacterized protein n=1 Tax=Catellatospora chokoriensis TaxID=310353 RepID=A0A8J3K5Q9_9ACTN|nr:hypothetical protein Cch02nite_67060 [Catellatospora chokoriensis]